MVLIGSILLFILQVVNLALLLRVVLSWITLPPNRFTYYLNQYTEPIVGFFRKHFPLRIGILDLSILIPFFLIALLNRVVTDIFLTNKLIRPLFAFIDLIIFVILGCLGVIFSVILILLVIYLFMTLLSRSTYTPLFYSIRSFMGGLLVRMESIFRMSDSVRSEVICIIVLIAALIIVYSGISWGLTALSLWLSDVMTI